jgi:hypothetical protein
MLQRIKTILIFIIFAAGISALIIGCGPRPPVSYQQLQIQDSSESQGYDIYMYISVKPGLNASQVEGLLKWFRDVKFPTQNKIKILVWDNPQAALMSAMGDNIGSLTVDRANGIDEIKVGTQ